MTRYKRRPAAALVMAALLLAPGPHLLGASPSTLALTMAPEHAAIQTASPPFGVFDSFDRLLPDSWGAASSGGSWVDNSLRENGRTSQEAGNALSVDGDAGVLSLGPEEPIWMLGADGPWRSPAWTMEATFMAHAIPTGQDSIDLGFWLFKDGLAPYGPAAHLGIALGHDTTPFGLSGVSLTGRGTDPNPTSMLTTDWDDSATYKVRWTHVWGSMSLAKVWNILDGEPDSWQLVRDASADRFHDGDNIAFQIEAFGSGAVGTGEWIRILDLSFQDSVPACGAVDSGNFPATETGNPGDEVHVRYDPSQLVDPKLPHAFDAAKQVARAIQARGQSSYDRYTGTGPGQFGMSAAPQIDVDLTCHIDIGFGELNTPAQVREENRVRYRVDYLRGDFGAAAEAWAKNPSGQFVPPVGPWSTTIDHELFHTIQLHALDCPFDACAVAHDTITESGATTAQDLAPDWDDTTDPSIAGTYMWGIAKFFAKLPGIDASFGEAIDTSEEHQTEYWAPGVFQYWGERYGPQAEPDLERRVAAFLDRLNHANGGQIDRYAEALRLGGARSNGDPIAALADFYVAAYAVGHPAPAAYHVLDDTTSTTGNAISTRYPTIVPTTLDLSSTKHDSLGSTEGRIFGIQLPASTTGWYDLRLTGHARPGTAALGAFETSYVGVAAVQADGTIQVNEANRFALYVAGDIHKMIHVDSAEEIGIIVVASERGLEYDLTVTPKTTAEVQIVGPPDGAAFAVNPTDRISVDVRPTIGGQLVTTLADGQVTFSADGYTDFEVRKTRPDAYHFLLRPRTPLPSGLLSITASFSGASDTVTNAYDVAPTTPQGPPVVIVPTVSSGSAGEPVVVTGLVEAGSSITNLSVSASVQPPSGAAFLVAMYDDGAHHDGDPNDQTFGAEVWGTDAQGAYSVDVTAVGTAGASPFDVSAAAGATLTPKVDVDSDGVADGVEYLFGASSTNSTDGARDDDLDGLGLAQELAGRTNPYSWDSDNGGETDASEAAVGGNVLVAADDAALPDASVVATSLDNRRVSVAVRTSDGTGTLDVVRSDGAAIVPLAPRSGAGETFIDGPLAPGDYTYVVASRSGGRAGGLASQSVTVADDVTSPFFTLRVAGGSWYAGSQVVSVFFDDRSESLESVRVATSAAALEAAAWRPYAPSVSVTLGGSGPRFVFAQARDAAGNVSIVAQAAVSVDVDAPMSSLDPLPSFALRVLNLTFATADASSGVVQVELWLRSRPTPTAAWSSWSSVGLYSASPITVELPGDGFYEFYTRAIDRAGNVEPAPMTADASTVVDTASPTSQVGSVPASTTAPAITLPISRSDATSGVATCEVYERHRSDPAAPWSAWQFDGSTSGTTYAISFASGYGDYEFYSIAVDAAGNRELAPASADATTRYLPEISWGSAIRVSAAGAATPTSPDVAIGGTGAADAVWMQGPSVGGDLFTSHYDPGLGTWAPASRLNTTAGSGDLSYPSIEAGGTDTAVAVWRDHRADGSGDIYSARRTASGWGPNIKVNDDTKSALQQQADVAVDANGKATAVWVDYRSNKKAIYSATLATGASTWSANLKVSTDITQYKNDPAVTFGPDGTAYAVWTYDPQLDFVNADVYFSKLTPGAPAWSSEFKVNDSLIQGAPNPSIAVAADGSLMVVWNRNAGARVSRSQDGGATWQPSSLAPAATSSGKLVTDASGTIFMVWNEAGVLMSRWLPATLGWSTPTMVSDISSAGIGALDATTSRVAVVWRDTRNGSNGEVYGRLGTRN